MKQVMQMNQYTYMGEPFTPSTTDLKNMIKAAEAKFEAAQKRRELFEREQAARELAERAGRINAQIIRASRENDARRYRRAGDRA